MEKLQPILKQKFWILLGVALIMSLTGWWLATASMVKEIQARSDQIKQSFDKVPKGKVPADSWSSKLTDLNKNQDKSIVVTRASLWSGQLKKLMDWPQGIQPNGYLGTFSNESKEDYKDVYVEEVKRVWKMLRPLETNGSGIVNYPLENMYLILHKEPGWKQAIPDKEMWEIKEDLLLLETLFQSIAAVNGGPDVLRSVDMIHQIDVLELRGGGVKPKASAGPNIPAISGTPTADLPTIPADFNPAEEFGDDGSTPLPRLVVQGTGAGAAGGGVGVNVGIGGRGRDRRQGIHFNPDDNDGVVTNPGPATTGPMNSGKPQGKPAERYIEKGDKGPFRTRGFYLLVEMDQQKIPQFLAELTANDRSVWPVEIIRVQTSRLHEDLQMGPGAATKLNYNGDGSEEAKTAAASLAKALANPNIAQVAICGIFTLYQKVDMPEMPAAPVAPPVTTPSKDGVTEPESSSDTSTDEPSSTSETNAESPASSDKEKEMSDDPAEKNSTTEPNVPENENPDSAPAKKETDEK